MALRAGRGRRRTGRPQRQTLYLRYLHLKRRRRRTRSALRKGIGAPYGRLPGPTSKTAPVSTSTRAPRTSAEEHKGTTHLFARACATAVTVQRIRQLARVRQDRWRAALPAAQRVAAALVVMVVRAAASNGAARRVVPLPGG